VGSVFGACLYITNIKSRGGGERKVQKRGRGGCKGGKGARKRLYQIAPEKSTHTLLKRGKKIVHHPITVEMNVESRDKEKERGFSGAEVHS